MGKTYACDVKDRVLQAAWRGDDWKIVAQHNGVPAGTAASWVTVARKTDVFIATPDQRGGATYRKINDEHVAFLISRLAVNCELTMEKMRPMLSDEFDLSVTKETIRRPLDAAYFTVKKLHRETEYRNSPVNKTKRRAFAVVLLAYMSEQKTICDMGETNFNLWVSRNYGWSRAGTRAVQQNVGSQGRNIHVIACVSVNGLEYNEARFGSFRGEDANDYVRRMLRAIALRHDLGEIVVVTDNAPCHARLEDVFREQEFERAQLLRLAPYSPMLNGIESVFSAYKAHVKRCMAANREHILAMPPTSSITEHRSSFLVRAAEDILPDVATAQICSRCIHHTLKFVSAAIMLEDMEIGQ